MKILAHSKETLALAELVRDTHARNAALARSDEFPAGASVWPTDLSRRHFLKMMGASLALAGVGGCNRPPRKELVPYTVPPEAGAGQGDEVVYYASAFPWEGFARGIVVATHSGRPTKIEGNPNHPESLGATDTFTQAAILSLYDPDRSKIPLQSNQPATWQAFDAAWAAERGRFLANRGSGLVLLTEPTTSPTLLRELHQFLDVFPQAEWYQHTPLACYDRGGEMLDYDFAAADVVFTIDADPFFTHPSAIRYSRAFTGRRKVTHGKVQANRLYTLEACPSITGSMADLRLPASPTRWPLVLDALGKRMGLSLTRLAPVSLGSVDALTVDETNFISALVKDFTAHHGRALCVVGEALPGPFHDFGQALNRELGAEGRSVHPLPAVRSDGDARSQGGMEELSQAIDSGKVATLIILDVNPVYSSGGRRGFFEQLRKVPLTIHLGEHVDETAEHAKWHLPQSHFLEAWADWRSPDGTATISQPLIEPLYETTSSSELLRRLSGVPGTNSYELVRETWSKAANSPEFETRWRNWLDRGIVSGVALPPLSAPANRSGEAISLPKLRQNSNDLAGEHNRLLTVVFKPDPTIADGRWSNHAWLQELPKPFTHLVWDNAVLIGPALARRFQLENGQHVFLETDSGELTAPVYITPGHADGCVTLHFGYGRKKVGAVGENHGFDAYPLRARPTVWFGQLTQFKKVTGSSVLVSTHDHFSMERRDLVHMVQVADLDRQQKPLEAPPSLYPEVRYTSYAWGMAIDLAVCIGCSACVVACQAENNIPVVGKAQVARGREMHWIRIDRYYEGNVESPRMLQQPVPCMQCENAPCELVCPVAATVHSSEGLNDMVYNRCVGTRYCSNNCPYKVRRFNFLDYREPNGSSVYLQKNPDVTVRERGVMEKCTYCVQRINAGRIRAERENRTIRDGEVVTACQQACPVEAIVFGDLNDPKSRVRARKDEPTNYALLEELNTRPRTTYLARVLNSPEPDSALTHGEANNA